MMRGARTRATFARRLRRILRHDVGATSVERALVTCLLAMAALLVMRTLSRVGGEASRHTLGASAEAIARE